MRRVWTVMSAAIMVVGMMTVTAGFRDLPIGEQPSWMMAETALWPVAALGVAEVGRLAQAYRDGLRVRWDGWRLLTHALPALGVAAAPAGTFTAWWTPASPLSLLDFPTAKVMAAVWLAYVVWTAWEGTPRHA